MKIENNDEQMEDNYNCCYQKSWHIMDMEVEI